MTINLPSLDVLRGLLATYVVIGHARWLLWAGHAAWVEQSHALWEDWLAYGSAIFRFGHEAVMVFFVLSGFFIHLRSAALLARGKPCPWEAGSFYRRRIHRLLAPYLFALAVTVVCDMAGRCWFPALYEARTGDLLLDQNFVKKGYSAESVLPALMLLPSAAGRDFGSNGPLWSIAYEVIYYALYPAWLLLRRRSSWLAYGIVPLGGFSLSMFPNASFFGSVLLHHPIWIAGAALAELMFCASLPRRAILIACVVFVGALALYRLNVHPAMSIMAAIAFGGAAVFGFGSWRCRTSRLRFGAWLQFLGQRSYSIYMVHFPVLTLIAAGVIERTGGLPMAGWLVAAGSMVSLVCGWAAFELCERHFLHRRLVLPGDAFRPTDLNSA